jgi:hypothetical protein
MLEDKPVALDFLRKGEAIPNIETSKKFQG